MARLRVLDPWLWPLLLMAVIFLLSAQPNLSSGLGLADLIARKMIHAVLFGALCAAWWRALRSRIPGPRRTLACALALTVLYAVSDEWHQTFVAGRSGSALDVAIDVLGAGTAALLRVRAGDRRHDREGAPGSGRCPP